MSNIGRSLASIPRELWPLGFDTALKEADLTALMIRSLYEIEGDERRLKALIEHLRLLDTHAYRGLRWDLGKFKDDQAKSISYHYKVEPYVWGSSIEARWKYLQAKESTGAKDPVWMKEHEALKRVMGFLEWLASSFEAAWEVIDRRRGEGWASRKPSAGEPTNTDVQHIYERGVSLYYQEKFAEALEHFRKAAKYGHPHSQNALGIMCVTGQGCARDSAEAAQWFKLAANQEDLRAWYNLHYLYKVGLGVATNPALSNRYLYSAAVRGLAPAQAVLGHRAFLGHRYAIGPQRDPAKATYWARLGAEQGNPSAMFLLAQFYKMGLGGVAADASEAAMWDDRAKKAKIDPFVIFWPSDLFKG